MTAAISRSQGQAGFSLLELLIATMIALLASLAIYQTLSVSEERKRTTSGGSEGLQAGIFGLAALERSITNAGFNLMVISDTAYISPIRKITPGSGYTLTSTNPPRAELHLGCLFTAAGASQRVAGLLATDGGTGLASDTLTIFTGSNADVPLPVPAETGSLPVNSSTVRLRSTHGFRVGDWVLVYEQNTALSPGTSRPVACTFARVNALPLAPAVSPGDITLSTPTVAAYVEPTVINLGANPSLEQFTVDANARLNVRNLLTGAQAQILAENVVSLQVQLGIDVGNDDVVDEWINPPAVVTSLANPSNPLPQNVVSTLPVPAGTRGFHQIKAVRVGMLIRSPQIERPDASGSCSTTASAIEVLPARPGNASSGVADMPSSGSFTPTGTQRCFRYNQVSSVVVVRNAVASEM